MFTDAGSSGPLTRTVAVIAFPWTGPAHDTLDEVGFVLTECGRSYAVGKAHWWLGLFAAAVVKAVCVAVVRISRVLVPL